MHALPYNSKVASPPRWLPLPRAFHAQHPLLPSLSQRFPQRSGSSGLCVLLGDRDLALYPVSPTHPLMVLCRMNDSCG